LNNSKSGFTLIELMVVMALLSVMTSFAVPAIRTALYSDQLKATARKLVGLVNETGQAARRNQQPYSLIFDRESRSFKMQSTAGQDDISKTATVKVPDGVEVVDFTSVHGGELTDAPRLRFTKKGYVDKTLIHLRDDDGRDVTLVLSPFLALSRLYDSYRSLEDDEIQW
jgi:general secretion pathway protein H